MGLMVEVGTSRQEHTALHRYGYGLVPSKTYKSAKTPQGL